MFLSSYAVAMADRNGRQVSQSQGKSLSASESASADDNRPFQDEFSYSGDESGAEGEPLVDGETVSPSGTASPMEESDPAFSTEPNPAYLHGSGNASTTNPTPVPAAAAQLGLCPQPLANRNREPSSIDLRQDGANATPCDSHRPLSSNSSALEDASLMFMQFMTKFVASLNPQSAVPPPSTSCSDPSTPQGESSLPSAHVNVDASSSIPAVINSSYTNYYS